MKWLVSPQPDIIPQLNDSPLVNKALYNRGIKTTEAYTHFITPSFKHLHDPSMMFGVVDASKRIAEAIKAKDPIVICGDYDVDGITGTVTMVKAIQLLGGVVSWYIPHRVEEGYGLHEESLSKLIDEGAKLIVSVDCGITALEPAKVCRQRGIDLIISDHHEWKTLPDSDVPLLPDAFALVHPRLQGPLVDYPNPELCGSGVAYKLAWAVARECNGGVRVTPTLSSFLREALAFTALGTIADVVPLTHENRTIAQLGLGIIPQTSFVGLKSLIASAGLDGKVIDGYSVGFMLGPRLNAAGRMGHANLATKMLLSDSTSESLSIAETLEQQNQKRQEAEKKIIREAENQYSSLHDRGRPTDVILVQSDQWHPGVVGIVASRLSEKFYKPSLVMVQDGGSGRSIEGFSLIKMLDSCPELLTRYGGHNAACGFHIHDGKLEEFREAVCRYAHENITEDMAEPKVRVEGTALLSEATQPATMDLMKLGPFGMGNRKPLFLFEDVTVVDHRKMGSEGQYISFVARQGNEMRRFVWFKPNVLGLNLHAGQRIDVVGEPALNEYRGTISVQIMVRDIRAVHQGVANEVMENELFAA